MGLPNFQVLNRASNLFPDRIEGQFLNDSRFLQDYTGQLERRGHSDLRRNFLREVEFSKTQSTILLNTI